MSTGVYGDKKTGMCQLEGSKKTRKVKIVLRSLLTVIKGQPYPLQKFYKPGRELRLIYYVEA